MLINNHERTFQYSCGLPNEMACRPLLPSISSKWFLLFAFLAVHANLAPAFAVPEPAKLTLANGAYFEQFGREVAIFGDTLAVGKYSENTDELGAVYVFTRVAGTWTLQAELTASDAVIGDSFGGAVGISGDTIVVGVSTDDVASNMAQGSAYVFVKPANGWVDMTQTAKLLASDGAPGEVFGVSVGIFNDTIIVGAPHADGLQGAAYVFTKPANGWSDATETAKLTPSDGAGGDFFAYAVGISGDTVAIGSLWDETGPNNIKGSVYVFEKPGGGWVNMTQSAKLTPSNGAEGIYSIAVSNDTIIAGALWKDMGANVDQGCAYVFVKPGPSWTDTTQTTELWPFDGAGYDLFGVTVAISGDTIVIGAVRDDVSGIIDQGSAYLFRKPDDGWSNLAEVEKLTACDGVALDQFGVVAISGNTVVVGVPWDDIGPNSAQGSVYVYDVSNDSVEPLSSICPSPESRKNRYISFVPRNSVGDVAFRVDKLSAPTGSCWVSAPDALGNSRCASTPVFRNWNDTVVHFGDCAITPVADYRIVSTADGTVFSDPLHVSTIALPAVNGKLWGDVVGFSNGLEWTPPNQITNVNDVLAILAYITSAAIKPTFQQANLQAISSTDPCLNAFVNTADVLAGVKAVAGDPYPFTKDPANCPVCP